MSKIAFGHSFLRNFTISRKFFVVFAVLVVSLGAVAAISMNGMRTIFGTFDRAADAYAASKLAGQIDSSVSRVIAAENSYLRLGGEPQAQEVKKEIETLKSNV